MRTILYSTIACFSLIASSAFADEANTQAPPTEAPATEQTPTDPQTPAHLDVPPHENAMAEDQSPHVVNDPPPRFRFLGMGFSVGVPSGVALGVVGRIPKLHFLKLELDGTYNGLAPGMKFGGTLDPIKFPIAPTFTLEAGGNWAGQVPGVNKSPTISYQYADALLGLELGSRDGFRFYIRGGVTHLWANASDLQKTVNTPSLTVGDLSVSGWAPGAQLGMQWLF